MKEEIITTELQNYGYYQELKPEGSSHRTYKEVYNYGTVIAFDFDSDNKMNSKSLMMYQIYKDEEIGNILNEHKEKFLKALNMDWKDVQSLDRENKTGSIEFRSEKDVLMGRISVHVEKEGVENFIIVFYEIYSENYDFEK